MRQKDHLPFFGIGPYYVGTIALLTAVGMIFSGKGYLNSGLVPELKTPMLVLGILLILLGGFIWGFVALSNVFFVLGAVEVVCAVICIKKAK